MPNRIAKLVTTFPLSILLILFILLPFQTAQAALTAEQIINKSSSLSELPYEVEQIKMIIVDPGGYKTVRELRIYARRFEGGLYRYLVIFDSPSGIRGTALLTWQNANGPDDQWLYLPALGQVKRIARSEKGNYFLGTDYTYSDLSGNTYRQKRYTLLGESTINNVPVYVIKDQAANYSQSLTQPAYEILYISKNNFVLMQTNYYNSDGKLLKSQILAGFKKVEGTAAWRPSIIVMKNFQAGSETIMEVLKHNFTKQAVPELYFTLRYIEPT